MLPMLLAGAGLLPARAGAYHLYFANLHCHTGYSDGETLTVPRDAYNYARDTAYIDVLSTSDHGELLDETKWDSTMAMSESATAPGRFLALAGFEWSSAVGHMNVIFTHDFTNALRTPTVPGVYSWMSLHDTVYGQFNHPEFWHFDTFAYSATGEGPMCEYEMQDTEHALVYTEALDSGWHVGMVSNEDNHDRTWGGLNQLTGIWADTLTRSSIYDALRKMRSYGSLNRKFGLQFFANDSWMGSTIPLADSIRFHVIGRDSSPTDSIHWVQILTNHGVIAESFAFDDTGTVDWQATIPGDSSPGRYYFARLLLSPGKWVQSSAVWMAGPTGVRESPNLTCGRQNDGIAFRPNPFISSVVLTIPACDVGEFQQVEVWGVDGRLLRILKPSRGAFGHTSVFTWDGRDERGRSVAPGVYFVSTEGGRRILTNKVLRLRGE